MAKVTVMMTGRLRRRHSRTCLSTRWGIPLALALAGSVAVVSPATAAPCLFIGGPQFGGSEPPLAVDAGCTDPDYNAETFVLDSTEELQLTLSDGRIIPYTEVRGHFPATRTVDQLPEGVSGSPTTQRHEVIWRFPDQAYWRNRFFQQTYPLPFDFLNSFDSQFAFENGGYTVSITPGSPNVGYRVPAAAAKLAKDFANRLYGNSDRIYGYIYGQSGGSVQLMGANEGTTGVWDGIVPVVIATDGLNSHSFLWAGLYALAVPAAKRETVAMAMVPGSGRDIYAGLNGEERAVLDELINAGFARLALEGAEFSVDTAMRGAGSIATSDPQYEADFWSQAGYEGTNPADFLTAALVDGHGIIAQIERNEVGTPTSVVFAPDSVPELGSIGADGLQYYVDDTEGARSTQDSSRSLRGRLEGNVLTLEEGRNDAALLDALDIGGRVSISNRFVLAAVFYPRHAILDNDSPAYDQYRRPDGTPEYVQRPVQVAYLGNIQAAGGRRETGQLRVRTIVMENLVDPSSYPYVAAHYADQVRRAMGAEPANDIFRVYFNENGAHFAAPAVANGEWAVSNAGTAGVLYQILLDLAAWAEEDIAPLPSTRHVIDEQTQVVLPSDAAERFGHQPVVHLTANGHTRAEVAVDEEVELAGLLEMPPLAGSLFQYDWYLGNEDFSYEPAVRLSEPLARTEVRRTVSFSAPGDYIVTLRAYGSRSGVGEPSQVVLQNIARVQVSVR